MRAAVAAMNDASRARAHAAARARAIRPPPSSLECRACNTHWADGNAPSTPGRQIGGVLRRRRDAHQDQHRARVRVLRAPPADADRLARQDRPRPRCRSRCSGRRQAVAQVLQRDLLPLLRGRAEDRLVVLAEELFEDVIKPNIFPRARDLIERVPPRRLPPGAGLGRRSTSRCGRWRATSASTTSSRTRSSSSNGYATGKLEKPFVAGATKADIMRDYATKHGIDLGELVGLLRQLLRLPDARRRRPPDRGQPRLPAALRRAQLRLAGARSDEDPIVDALRTGLAKGHRTLRAISGTRGGE